MTLLHLHWQHFFSSYHLPLLATACNIIWKHYCFAYLKASFPATITNPIILHFFAVLCSASYEDNAPDILLRCRACHFTTIIIGRCSNGKVVCYNNIFLCHDNDYIFHCCIHLLFCFSRRCIPSHAQLQGSVKNTWILITDLGVWIGAVWLLNNNMTMNNAHILLLCITFTSHLTSGHTLLWKSFPQSHIQQWTVYTALSRVQKMLWYIILLEHSLQMLHTLCRAEVFH